MRISIIGLGGSGKTHLAKRLARELGVPLISLDRIWISSGGETMRSASEKETARQHLHGRVRELIEQPDWICEGVYRRIQPEITAGADIVIYLPKSLPRRVTNHFVRTFRPHERHPELSLLDDLKHTFVIIRKHPKRSRHLRELLATSADKLVVLPDRHAVNQMLRTLPADTRQVVDHIRSHARKYRRR